MGHKIIDVTPILCTGCRACEVVCSIGRTGQANPYRSAIRIERILEDGVIYPIVCHQCDEPSCLPACPTAAMSRNQETGAIVIDYERCIGCRACVIACPFGAVGVDPDGKPVKCDLCDGDPKCIRFCLERPPDSSLYMANPRKPCLEYVRADRSVSKKRAIELRRVRGLRDYI